MIPPYRCEVCEQENWSLGDDWYVLLAKDGRRYVCGRECLVKWARKET